MGCICVQVSGRYAESGSLVKSGQAVGFGLYAEAAALLPAVSGSCMAGLPLIAQSVCALDCCSCMLKFPVADTLGYPTCFELLLCRLGHAPSQALLCPAGFASQNTAGLRQEG